MVIYPTKVDLRELAAQVLGQGAAHPGNAFILTADGNLSGEWDGDRLRQLLTNLLENAVKHRKESGPINLAVRTTEGISRDDREEYRTADSQKLLSMLFEPMARLALSDSTEPPGSMGLRLYICKEVVRAHRGAIEVSSSDDGTTIFTITLPRGHETARCSCRADVAMMW